MIWNLLDIIMFLKIYVCFNLIFISKWRNESKRSSKRPLQEIFPWCEKNKTPNKKYVHRNNDAKLNVVRKKSPSSSSTIIFDWLMQMGDTHCNKQLRSVGPQLERGGGHWYEVRGTQWIKCEVKHLLMRGGVFSSYFPSFSLSFSLFLSISFPTVPWKALILSCTFVTTPTVDGSTIWRKFNINIMFYPFKGVSWSMVLTSRQCL